MPDCVIIGGGPAGLTAAIYLSRFHLDVLVIDAGQSRARWIPMTHNHAGFPDGISGSELLQQMRAQAELYGTQIIDGRVTRISKNGDDFTIEYRQGEVQVPVVLLAMGGGEPSPRCRWQAFMRRAMLCWGSTKSVMPWARAGWLPLLSETISRNAVRCFDKPSYPSDGALILSE